MAEESPNHEPMPQPAQPGHRLAATIYAIHSTSNRLVYYGATGKSIHERFNKHKQCDNATSSKRVVAAADATIEAIETVEGSKKEIAVREGAAIRGHALSKWANCECVNMNMPSRTKQEYFELNKEKIYSYLGKPIPCDVCQCPTSMRNRARHNKSKRHLAALARVQAAAVPVPVAVAVA